MGDGLFGDAIEAHRALQRRNARLERTMPIARYLENPDDDATDAGPSRDVEAEAPANGSPPNGSGVAAPWDDPESWWSGDPTDWGS